MLGEAGFDPVYGARPLRRVIQTQLENRLAKEILSGAFASGDTVDIDFVDGDLTFTEINTEKVAWCPGGGYTAFIQEACSPVWNNPN